ncbi:MAG: ATP-binding protein [Acidimicrobiales bacterium]
MATQLPQLHPRYALEQLLGALADTPVVAVNGARQVGKSTLVTELLTRPGDAQLVTLDDQTQRAAALADPRTFVRRDGLLIIDEVQRVPDLLPAIKAEVDRDRRPGRFLLTGSARLPSPAEMSASLAGRVEIIDLWPLSQGELGGRRERFVDALFSWDLDLRRASDASRSDYLALACAGGFPEPQLRSGRRRGAWFSNYATTVLQRMVTDVADVERITAVPRLL